jgi:hypothetical protein
MANKLCARGDKDNTKATPKQLYQRNQVLGGPCILEPPSDLKCVLPVNGEKTQLLSCLKHCIWESYFSINMTYVLTTKNPQYLVLQIAWKSAPLSSSHTTDTTKDLLTKMNRLPAKYSLSARCKSHSVFCQVYWSQSAYVWILVPPTFCADFTI